ncbi:hypothetical protein [Streptomyces sp. NBC_00470]|uniref:hypothetical protein n=1 Tax=Streptomyces sp. NBC_00470 TaxID=2975753 RepID=UPI002F907308
MSESNPVTVPDLKDAHFAWQRAHEWVEAGRAFLNCCVKLREAITVLWDEAQTTAGVDGVTFTVIGEMPVEAREFYSILIDATECLDEVIEGLDEPARGFNPSLAQSRHAPLVLIGDALGVLQVDRLRAQVQACCPTCRHQLAERLHSELPEVGDTSDTAERTPLLHGTCVRIQMGPTRYETRADGQVLAAAQFHPSGSDGEGITGWIVSGTSSNRSSEPIDSQDKALKLLDDVTRAERVLLRRYPKIYPAVPPVAHEQTRRDFPEMRRLNKGS